jgi:hypothetical protein
MALLPEQHEIAKVVGYEPVTKDEGSEQYPADINYQLLPTGNTKLPRSRSIYRNKRGTLRCFWIPSGNNYTSEEKESFQGWYDVPDLEDIEEWTFDSVCSTPAGDDVEPDHPDSWLSILGII